MRIRYKVALVGGIPITIAAAIAVTAWLLLGAAERTRNGAVLAGAVYRDLSEVMTERDEYIGARPAERSLHASNLTDAAVKGLSKLEALAELAGDPAHRAMVHETRDALSRYRDRMWDLMRMTIRNDRLIAEIGARAESLVEFADKARERQRTSNSDIIASLAQGDRRLRFARDIVDRAQELRAAIAAMALQQGQTGGDPPSERITPVQQLSFSTARLRNAANDLAQILREDSRTEQAEELLALMHGQEVHLPNGSRPAGVADASDRLGQKRLADWVERLIKVNSTEQRALHEEVAQLLTYSVNAAETEQATQNIAIESLKLGRRTADALAARDAAAADQILVDSRTLADRVASLPISPLIQADMIDAIERWREGLATTSSGLRGQNEIISDMDTISRGMRDGARDLNDLITNDADRIGQVVRTILLMGAAVGLLVGSGTALVVARSITRPLKRLQEKMIELAADPKAGPIAEAARRDELGSMAQAANFFVNEISRREEALRLSKDQADATLAELKVTQSNLIQAEKLASLGQLVAGVAHEINTPLGVALTTSTALEREVGRLGDQAASGRLSKSEFSSSLARLTEGSRLLLSNLTRAIDLVYSFKQVAADQASGERRRFELKGWLDELLTSLGPVLRKSGHEVVVDCPADLVLDTYPGSLGQVLTNLVMNAIVHAYRPGQSGRLTIKAALAKHRMVRLTFADNGQGIAPDHLPRIFDPFFTTGRDRGGTGLGLHIVYNLVTARLQGGINVKSSPGMGTRFTIDLPITVGNRPAEPAMEIEQERST
jgi:signal transduction histidine kinase